MNMYQEFIIHLYRILDSVEEGQPSELVNSKLEEAISFARERKDIFDFDFDKGRHLGTMGVLSRIVEHLTTNKIYKYNNYINNEVRLSMMRLMIMDRFEFAMLMTMRDLMQKNLLDYFFGIMNKNIITDIFALFQEESIVNVTLLDKDMLYIIYKKHGYNPLDIPSFKLLYDEFKTSKKY